MKCKHCDNKALEQFDCCYCCTASWSKPKYKLATDFKLARMYGKLPPVSAFIKETS